MTNDSTKQRLALLLNAFWVNRAGMSGGDRRCMEIFRRIGHHFELTAYTSEDGKRALQPCLPYAAFVVMPPHLLERNLCTAYVRRARWMTNQIRQRPYDIVYASSDFFPDTLPCCSYRRRNPRSRWIQCVFHVYPPLSQRPGSLLRNWLGRSIQQFSFSLIKRNADAVISLSRQTKDQLVSLGFRADQITVIPCGTDSNPCASIGIVDKRLKQGCFIGRISPTKGIFDLVEIWRLVADAHPDAVLKIVGNGPDRLIRKLRCAIDNAGLASNIELCGFLDDTDAVRALKSSSIFLMPSHEEGFGMVIAEAMACGVPTVAWNLPVYDEIYPAALTKVDVGNTSRFAEEILNILHNRELAGQIVARGHELVRQYDWDRIAENELRVITSR